MKNVSIIICLLAFCILHAAQGFAQNPRAEDRPPNIVLIVSDDQGWADIGYNNADVFSPNLDRLAAEGVVLKQHYVMPQCTPTRVALMTGRYPSRFGGAAMNASNKPSFPLGTPTLASALKDAGYSTFLAGKWHLGSDPKHGPNHFGFQQSYGSLAGAVGMYDHRYRAGGPFEHTWHRDHKLIQGAENGTHATDLISKEAVRVIQKKHAQPFFLYVPFHSVHTPLDERGKFTDRPTQLDPDNDQRWLDEDKIRWFNDPKGIIQRETDPEKRLLLASVYHLDFAIGQIVDAIKNSGQGDDTLILFSSDNGPQGSWPGNAYPDDLKLTDFNQPLPMRGKKLDVWEGGIHVPGIIHWPKKLKHRSVKTPTHIVDWFPTLATIAGASCIANGDGADLTDLLLAGKSLPERALYWTWHPSFNRWALRKGDWKIVKYGKGAPTAPTDWQLYNLANDPREKSDLSNKQPEVLKSLHRQFLDQRQRDARR